MNTRKSFLKKTGIAGAMSLAGFINPLFPAEVRKGKQSSDAGDRTPPDTGGVLVKRGWNTYSKRFINAPVFEVNSVPSASSYEAFVGHHIDFGKPLKVSSNKPKLDFGEIWDKIAPGTSYQVRIQAVNAANIIVAGLPAFSFHKSFPFNGSPYAAKTQYLDSSRLACDYLLKLLEPVSRAQDSNLVEAVEKSLTTFKFLHYPAFLVSTYIDVLLKYQRSFPDSPKSSLVKRIVPRLGDYLLHTRTPRDYVYALMPISHSRHQFPTIEKYKNMERPFLQVPRSCQAGNRFLDLHEAANEDRYLDAAVQICRTLKKNQKPDGSFAFRVDALTGKVIDENTSDQVNPMLLLDRLVNKHGMMEFSAARDATLRWLFENPVKSFLWQGQYEDIREFPDYQNLEFLDIQLFVRYMTDNIRLHPEYLPLARKLFDFVEDQFVMWENSFDSNFITPAVCEQYRCYKTIDYHSGVFIKMCVDLYSLTREPIYLEKAKALANLLTQVQHPDGYYPTWLLHPPGKGSRYGELGEISYERFWPNCTAMVAMGLMELGLAAG